MNILIFSWRGPKHPHAGGAEIATLTHAKAWVKHGHTVTLFTSYFPKAKKEEYIYGVRVIRQGSEILGVRIKAIVWYLFLSKNTYDVIVDEFHGLPFFTPLFVRQKKLSFIHEVAKEVWKHNPWPTPFNYIPAIFGKFGEPFIFKLYKKIPFITVSNSTRKDLLEWGIPSRNISVIHNGLTIVVPKSLPKKQKVVSFLGALAKDKGVEDVIRSFADIYRQDKEWKLYIIGKGAQKYLTYLKQLGKNVGLQNSIIYTGFVDERRKVELLAKSYLLLNPSRWEGWGLTVIEAAAVNTPTIGYNVAGLRDSIQDKTTGILTRKNTPEEIAREVMELVKKPEMYAKLQKQGKTWAKSLTWEKATHESLTLLENLK